jgi:hypothetical protein
MGAEYLFYLKSIATFAPTFYGYIISVLASVICLFHLGRASRPFSSSAAFLKYRISSNSFRL